MKRILPLATLVLLAACTERSELWSASSNLSVEGLRASAVVLDTDASRAVVLHAKSPSETSQAYIPLGKNVLTTAVSPDKSRLFVLSAGEQPRRNPDDESPRLTIVESDGTSRALDLPSTLSKIAVDPLGQWVVIYAGSDSTAFTFNPNELLFIDLTTTDETQRITSRTLRSFGGRPQRLTFSSPLSLPAGQKRILVVETEQDISLLDLDHLHDATPRPEVTVRLTDGTTSSAPSPSAVVIDDGDPTKNDDARIGVRLSNSSNVVSIALTPPPSGGVAPPNDFVPVLNLTDVGGVASDLAFLRTDAGIRLAALVPSLSEAVLVDPETSVTSVVDLPEAYSTLSLISNAVGAQGGDVALLSGSASRGSAGVAFWALGKVTGQPYRSVEVIGVGGSVIKVIDVPEPRTSLKIVKTAGSGFYVLDLVGRTASPLATQSDATLLVSSDGERMWAYGAGSTSVSKIALDNLHPTDLPMFRPVTALFDLAADDGGRSLLTVDASGAGAFTALDAKNPDITTAKVHVGLTLEGL